jgi:hypothetical protein
MLAANPLLQAQGRGEENLSLKQEMWIQTQNWGTGPGLQPRLLLLPPTVSSHR